MAVSSPAFASKLIECKICFSGFPVPGASSSPLRAPQQRLIFFLSGTKKHKSLDVKFNDVEEFCRAGGEPASVAGMATIVASREFSSDFLDFQKG